jgi:large repetitive protein
MNAVPRLALLALAVALPGGLGDPPAAPPSSRAGASRGAAPAVPAAPVASAVVVAPEPPPGADPEAAARAALAARAPAWGLTAAGAAQASLVGRHDPGAGPVVLVFRRRLGDVEVLGEQAAVVLDRRGAAVATLGALDGGLPRPGDGFTLGEAAAAARALAAVTGLEATPGALRRGRTAGPWQAFTLGDQGASARVRRAWLPGGGALVATWAVEVLGPAGEGRRAELAFLGDDGAVRSRRSLVFDAAYAWRVWADGAAPFLPWDGPGGLAGTPHPTGLPDGFQPAIAPQALVTLAHASATRPDPWLAEGATETTGNNADVYAVLGENPVTIERGAASGPAAFDRIADLSLPPAGATNRQAGLAHAFYVVNALHDWLADAGFDESAGNAQADNLGRGGLGGDPLVVQTQVPSVRNNAQMFTPGDGASPILQLGLFTGITGRYVAWGTPPAGRPDREEATSASFGAPVFDLPAPLVPVDDGVAPVGDGCDDGVWASDVAGRIALLDSTACAGDLHRFSDKALRAQARQAAGVLIANDAPGQYLFLSFEPADARVAIPVLGLKQEVGAAFRAAAASGGGAVPARMHRSAAAPTRDGAVDTLLVAHEWGHHVSNRLVGGGVGLGGLQPTALGEGWSDFLALLLAVREEDAGAAAQGGLYTYGSWVLGGAEGLFGGPNQSYYFGMRRVPYTTDFTRNALTLRHIQQGEPLPLATPGGAVIPFADNGLGISDVHNVGEVWATMLWECYAALLGDTTGPAPRLDFAEARARMLRYLVASLKATPPDPTFLQARDALLAVAQAGDPADLLRFRQALARRGAGQGATGPDVTSPDNRPVVESYLAPPPESPPPVITGLVPTSGPPSGGTTVIIAGSGFTPGARVGVGGVAAPVDAVTASTVTITAPPHASGRVDVTVTNPDGQWAARAAAYDYLAPPPPPPSPQPGSGGGCQSGDAGPLSLLVLLLAAARRPTRRAPPGRM